MIVIQVVPKGDRDVYKMLRSKVIHEATTWYWSNKAKTRLKHVRSEGYIEVDSANGVLVARVYPRERSDLFYLSEKLIGRLVAWFEEDMAAINIQFVPDPKRRKKR